jgi:peptidoglycan/LPS O-acetylase OafA/YrhL
MGVDMQYLWQRTLAALTFTSGFSYVTFFPSDINGALWSISFEVFCYILLPIFMFFLYKFGKKRTFKKALLYWCGIILMLILVNELIHIYLTPDDVDKGWQFGNIGGAKYWMPRYNPIGFFAQFSIGIIAAGITTQLFAVKDKLVEIKSKGIFDIISAISLLSAFSLLWNLRYAPEFSFSIQNQPYFFPYFQVLVAITLITAPHSNIFGKILDNKFFRYTSRVSFGLYVWHHLIISFVVMKWVSDYKYMGMNDMGKWLQVSLFIMIASYVIATISYYCVEKPVLDLAHNKK